MKKLIIYIQSKIDKYVVKRFQKLMPKELIRTLYRSVAEGDLDVTVKIIEVKKGRIKYYLVIAKDKDLKTKFTLSRHEV
jgi:hypothetical protein